MATALLHYTAAAASDCGRKRPSNEDAYAFSVEHGAYVVCDGMGGAAAGEVASSLAVDEFMRQVTGAAEKRAGAGANTPDVAVEAVHAANQAIFTRAQSNPKLSGMGTTLVALVAGEGEVRMLNVGDSRGYRLRGRRLEQITLDHSLVEEQVRSGRMNQADAQRSPLRNVITRALGTQSTVTPDVFLLEVAAGDLFLLASDGLTRELSDQLIESILSLDLPLDTLCARLVRAANQAGGHDNITSLLVRADRGLL